MHIIHSRSKSESTFPTQTNQTCSTRRQLKRYQIQPPYLPIFLEKKRKPNEIIEMVRSSDHGGTALANTRILSTNPLTKSSYWFLGSPVMAICP